MLLKAGKESIQDIQIHYVWKWDVVQKSECDGGLEVELLEEH